MNFIIPLVLTLSFAPLPAFSPLPHERSVVGANSLPAPLQPQDNELTTLRRLDREGRTADGQLELLAAQEHVRRGGIYMANRAFPEAREHFRTLIARYPNDVNISAALYGIARSHSQMREYRESLPFFERVVREYPHTKDGREGLYYFASALLRLLRSEEAAARYREYTERFPAGERIEFAYLNVIDSLREAGHSAEAIIWIAKTRERFSRTPTATNAHFARLRLDVADGDWQHAIQTADELRSVTLSPRVGAFSLKVMTNADEVAYLRAYSLDRAGKTSEAVNAYLAIPDAVDSYYGGLATTRLATLVDAPRRSLVTARTDRVNRQINSMTRLYPVPYREPILREANRRTIDPRLVLAIMREESAFRPRAKSIAAARGLLQLTIDTATRYAAHVGLNNLIDEDLYRPEISILLGSAYLSELSRQFPNLPEAVAASYNGGEDNVARWVKRAKQHDPGVFAAEVGFEETKNYVYKVMATYRAYKHLYTKDLRRR